MICAIGSGISLTINSLEVDAQVDVLMEIASMKFPQVKGFAAQPDEVTVVETAVNFSLYFSVVGRV